MVQETEAEAVVEGQPAQAEDLGAKVAELQAALEAAQTEAKSHQKYGQQTRAELDRQRGLDTKVDGLESRLQVVTEMLADVIDRGGDEDDEPRPQKKRRSEEYLARIPNTTASAQKAREAEFLRVANEADGLARSGGFAIATSPELEKAYLYFQAGQEVKGLEEVKRVVGETKKTEALDTEEIDKRIQEGIRKEMEKRGLLDSDTGGPSGTGSMSAQDAKRAYIKGEITADKAKEMGAVFD